MKPEPLKLASIITLMLGGMTSVGVRAMDLDAATAAARPVMAPDGTSRAWAPVTAIDLVQDGTSASDDSQVVVGEAVPTPDNAQATEIPATQTLAPPAAVKPVSYAQPVVVRARQGDDAGQPLTEAVPPPEAIVVAEAVPLVQSRPETETEPSMNSQQPGEANESVEAKNQEQQIDATAQSESKARAEAEEQDAIQPQSAQTEATVLSKQQVDANPPADGTTLATAPLATSSAQAGPGARARSVSYAAPVPKLPPQAEKTVAGTAVLATLVGQSEAEPPISATERTARTEVTTPTDTKPEPETGKRLHVEQQIEMQAALTPYAGANQPASRVPSAFVTQETRIAQAMQSSGARPVSYAAPIIITPPTQVEQTTAATAVLTTLADQSGGNRLQPEGESRGEVQATLTTPHVETSQSAGMMPSALASQETGIGQASQRSGVRTASYAAPVITSAQTEQTLAVHTPPEIKVAESSGLTGADLALGSASLSDAAPIAVPRRADVRRTEDGRPDLTRNDPNWPPGETVALDAQQLDSMRGGFDLPSGLQVSFGISRVAFVNGNVVSTTNFNIPDVSAITVQQAQALAALNTGVMIHNGVVQPSAIPGLTGTVIQNSLNNQKIQALTTINTTVNSLAPFKMSNFVSTLNNALTSTVRPR